MNDFMTMIVNSSWGIVLAIFLFVCVIGILLKIGEYLERKYTK